MELDPIVASVLVCVASLVVLLVMLRSDRVSLGLPAAYLFLLILNHVPGALAHLDDLGLLSPKLFTEIGIRLTAIAMTCFVAGVWLARSMIPAQPIVATVQQRKFWLFCIGGGSAFFYLLSPLLQIPSIGAVVKEGSTLWFLGSALALRFALQQRSLKVALPWLIPPAFFTADWLLRYGFLSYSTEAIMVIVSILAIWGRSMSKVLFTTVLCFYLGVSGFVNYFEQRPALRAAIGAGVPIGERIDVFGGAIRNFRFADLHDPLVLFAFDQRLNQNYFVGLSDYRIEHGEASYLHGGTVFDGIAALVPRALWPQKPVAAGSGDIVADATGLALNPFTSWGVGQVMEYNINFGLYGMMIGFVLLGLALGSLDRKAAIAEAQGDYGKLLLFYLPGVVLIEPIVSTVETAAGVASALLAALFWNWAWKQWLLRPERRVIVASAAP